MLALMSVRSRGTYGECVGARHCEAGKRKFGIRLVSELYLTNTNGNSVSDASHWNSPIRDLRDSLIDAVQML